MNTSSKKPFLPEALKQLPAVGVVSQALELLEKGQVLIVEGGTGSGKSVVIPTMIAEAIGDVGKRIVVTQNRRILCSNMAAFLSKQMGSVVGETVGYSYKGSKRVSAKTILSFVTTGTLLRQIERVPELDGIECVVVDEIHEGMVEQHVLLTYLKRILATRPGFKIVLMSATLSADDRQRFKKFFGNVGLVSVSGRTFPVKTVYSGHTFNSGKPYRVIRNDVLKAVYETILHAHNETDEGTIICFLPGKDEILELTKRLAKRKLPVFPLYAQCTDEEKQAAIAPIQSGRKIVLATDVARSGITVEGVKAVVSSGFSRIGQVEGSRQVSGIRTVLTDKAALKQEGGRTGRTCSGTHYIVGHELTTRPEHAAPLIQTTDITGFVLRMWAKEGALHNFDWFVPPGIRQLSAAQKCLESLGAIQDTDEVGYGGAFKKGISETGRTMATMPVDPPIARFLIEAARTGVGNEGAVIAAALMSGTKLPQSWSSVEVTYSEGYQEKTMTRKYTSDVEAILSEYEQGYFDQEEHAAFRQALDECRSMLSSFPGSEAVEADSDRLEALRKALLVSFGHNAGIYVPSDFYFKDGDSLEGGCFYTGPNEESFKFMAHSRSRYGDKTTLETPNGIMLVPLNLFYFEDRVMCDMAIETNMNEYKSLFPKQADKMDYLHELIGEYRPSFTGYSVTTPTSAHDRLLVALFGS